MWRSRRRPDRPQDDARGGLGESGAAVALEQVGQWVRFADTKATIIAAGIGVVLSFLAASADEVAAVFLDGGAGAWIVAALGAATLTALVITLTYVVSVIRPRTEVRPHQLNRFAWPAVAEASVSDLEQRATTDPQPDAWEQVHSLAQVARRKYAACDVAVCWFAVLVVASVLSVTAASFVQTFHGRQDKRGQDVCVSWMTRPPTAPTATSPKPRRSTGPQTASQRSTPSLAAAVGDVCWCRSITFPLAVDQPVPPAAGGCWSHTVVQMHAWPPL